MIPRGLLFIVERYFPCALRAALLAPALFLATGCYTFQVPSTIDRRVLLGLPSSSRAVLLIIRPDYREFVSKDRGNLVADPQTYEIGPALSDLTETYFGHVFGEAMLIASLRGEGLSNTAVVDFVVEPSIAYFDNNLLMRKGAPLLQSLTIELEARVSNVQGENLGVARGRGISNHSFAVFRESEERISAILNRVIQQALSRLASEVVQLIEPLGPN